MATGSCLNILTFNWHEAYLTMLARTGHLFHAVEVAKGGHFGWQYNMRPLPENITLLQEAEALARLRAGDFDLVVCHNMRDLLAVEGVDIPKILVFHNKISTEIALGGHRATAEQYRTGIRDLAARNRLTLVFISESKRENCALEGPVILPGIDLNHYGGYKGEVERVLRVGNLMKERDIMLGFSWQEEILRGIPSTLVGINPTVAESRVSESWQDLKNHYQSHRLFLNSTLHPWEDGYNLAMLEAMATGMPVVSIANPTSPIVDGINGYISQDTAYLRHRIEELLSDREKASELGRQARKTVEKRFPMARFVRGWNRLFEKVMERSTNPAIPRWRRSPEWCRGGRSRSTRENTVGMKNVLLCYTSNPTTTGCYLERSFRRHHNVITCGPAISREMIRAWNLENMKEKPRTHDFSSASVDLRVVMGSVGKVWRPDFLLWVETGIWFPLEGLDSLDCPRACYLIDTHLHRDLHLRWARNFDVVFLAQRAYIPIFQEAGIERVYWLPLACDRDIHGRKRVKKRYDIGFVGSITAGNQRRIALLDRLSKRFDLHVERCFLKDMARVFSASRIVFNNAIKDDLNMRVFEVLASGSLLLTDRARGSGLEDLFQDRVHLVIYEDESLEDIAGYYLDHEEEREAIAARGRREVLMRHTYDHRVREIINRLGDVSQQGSRRASWRAMRGFRRRPQQGPSPASSIPGEKLEEKGCLTEARERYWERLKRDPSDRRALMGLGRISIRFQKWQAAESYLQRAVDVEEDWESLFLLARCKMNSGKQSEALAYLDRARDQDGRDPRRRTAVLSAMGECLGQLGDYERAEASFVEAAGVDPSSDEAWTGLGEVESMRGNHEKAEGAFRKAVGINSKNDRARCGLGLAVWERGKRDEAIEILQRALDINPENLVCLNRLLGCCREEGMFNVAERYLKEYLRVHPLNCEVLYGLGSLYYEWGRYEEARRAAETILMFEPNHKGANEMTALLAGKEEKGSEGRPPLPDPGGPGSWKKQDRPMS
ncbi:MAG: glycosyltransferase [Deltaproteobacteria bacterium]|nr:glycosyltransferase [Deltaproteobacteria bacterium]